ncbi:MULTISPECIES: hypothetical protein [Silvimonas]|uniref:hypothetical protein n=1 Tax=Silvimonas TaxID=300264 RepID=UPI0024B33DD5|nr:MULTISPECIES: hypothetical protein [Silvimonas]MDR3427112.1 hypothetical protein [Silvimonas sp.]
MRYQIIPVYEEGGSQQDEVGWVVINPAGFRVSIVYSVDALWLAERQCDYLQSGFDNLLHIASGLGKTVLLNTSGRFPGVVLGIYEKHVLVDAGREHAYAVEIFLLNQAGISLHLQDRVKLAFIEGRMVDLAPPGNTHSVSC